MSNGEATVSMALVLFNKAVDLGRLVVVGTSNNPKPVPRTTSGGFIRLYRMTSDGRELELVHKTQVEDVPVAIESFQGRLLVGVGSILRLYDIGKKRLLRKCEYKHFPNLITSVQYLG